LLEIFGNIIGMKLKLISLSGISITKESDYVELLKNDPETFFNLLLGAQRPGSYLFLEKKFDRLLSRLPSVFQNISNGWLSAEQKTQMKQNPRPWANALIEHFSRPKAQAIFLQMRFYSGAPIYDDIIQAFETFCFKVGSYKDIEKALEPVANLNRTVFDSIMFLAHSFRRQEEEISD
jgi:hypothetical protein